MNRTPLTTITDCGDCGACCTGQEALPTNLVGHFGIEGVNPLPPELRDELLAAIERFKRDGWPKAGSPCIWYDAQAKKCKNYDYRPTICRDEVQAGDQHCRRWQGKAS